MANKAKPVNFTKSSVDISKDQSVIVSADFNGDKNVDIVTSSVWYGSTGISILLGDGKGGFSSPNTYKSDSGVYFAIAKDFNNDGKMDLATSNKIFIGDGKGSFTKTITTELQGANQETNSLVSGDFNNDGKIDLAAIKPITNTSTTVEVSISLGDGKGGFSTPADFPISPTKVIFPKSYQSYKLTKVDPNDLNATDKIEFNSNGSILAGDFNGDGNTDLCAVNMLKDSTEHWYIEVVASIITGDGKGNFSAPVSFDLNTNREFGSSISGDFNADGKVDIATLLGSSVSVLLGDGNGNFDIENNYKISFGAKITAGDIDDNGLTDIIVANNEGSNVAVLLQNSTGKLTQPTTFYAGFYPTGVTLDDFNNDKKLDIAVLNKSNSVSVLLNTDNSIVSKVGTLTAVPKSGSLNEVQNNYGFAVIKSDGSVVTWGNSYGNGADSSAVTDQLYGVTQIYSNDQAFAALRANGSVVTWGQTFLYIADWMPDDISTKNHVDILKKLSGFESPIKTIYSTQSSFSALREDGSVVCWGWAEEFTTDSTLITSGAVSKELDGTIDVTAIYTNSGAFAALRADGSVITWGSKNNGADSSLVSKELDGSIDVTNIYSSNSAFAALRKDGSVVTWGVGGYDEKGKPAQIEKNVLNSNSTSPVAEIYSNGQAFAALRADGSVITFGDLKSGGNSSSVAQGLSGAIDVSKIYSHNGAFAALRADGSVISWGSGGYEWNGTTYKDLIIDSNAVAKKLDGVIDVTKIYSTGSAFAALRVDGSVVTWGQDSYGGDSKNVAAKLDGTIDVTNIFSGYNKFAALRADGSVVVWGAGEYDMATSKTLPFDSSSIDKYIDGKIDVTQIYSNMFSFAALRADGSVITWGDKSSGGDSSSVAKELDGTVDVTKIYSNSRSFAALRADGSVVTWGDKDSGGDSSSVEHKLVSGVVSFADPSTDDFYTVPTNPPVISNPVKPTTVIDGKKITGTAKADVLIGSDGNDTITGGAGFDTLTGGKGADKFIFKSIKDAPLSRSKIEIVTDFSSKDGDKIDLSGIDANADKAKDQAFSKPTVGNEFSGEFTAVGQLYFDTTDAILYGNVNKDEAADFAIQLSGVKSLVAGDFIL